MFTIIFFRKLDPARHNINITTAMYNKYNVNLYRRIYSIYIPTNSGLATVNLFVHHDLGIGKLWYMVYMMLYSRGIYYNRTQ